MSVKQKREAGKMTVVRARKVAAGIAEIEDVIGIPASRWGGNCHGISLAVLRTGLFGKGRIARGRAEKVRSQHSWIVLGDDVYDRDALVVDPTRWAYTGSEPHIEVARNRLVHVPHGAGSIWHWGRPENAAPGDEIGLKNPEALSREARHFLEAVGPLDLKGWSFLAHAPMQGWPACEIISAMDDTPQLAALVPIDILGMVTDRNPKGLYR